MNTRSPSSFRAVSSLHLHPLSHNGKTNLHRIAIQCIPRNRNRLSLTRIQPQLHRYASTQSNSRSNPESSNNNNSQNTDLDRPEKAALVEISGQKKSDPINPSRSTLPPPLKLPTRGDSNLALYYFRVGRSYGSFYWLGIKAVWYNYQAAKHLRGRMKKESGSGKRSPRKELDLMTRSEFQLLARNSHDIGKLPFFGLLVALFGEWLPLIVPFIPGAVPGTCRIPKQIEGMRKKAEERRRISFRQGISEPTVGEEQLRKVEGEKDMSTASAKEWPMTQKEYAAQILSKLNASQLLHLSSTLNLHNRLWDRVQLPPPAFLLRSGVSKHLSYLTSDDLLLQRYGGAQKLTAEEVDVACEERGIDVLGRSEQTLRENLSWWLARQDEDKGRGEVLFTMLFRRPNAWDQKKDHNSQNSGHG